jgi:hypothetical protein
MYYQDIVYGGFNKNKLNLGKVLKKALWTKIELGASKREKNNRCTAHIRPSEGSVYRTGAFGSAVSCEKAAIRCLL